MPCFRGQIDQKSENFKSKGTIGFFFSFSLMFSFFLIGGDLCVTSLVTCVSLALVTCTSLVTCVSLGDLCVTSCHSQ